MIKVYLPDSLVVWAVAAAAAADRTVCVRVCCAVHIDDLSRNFALNPQSGLQCTPYKLHGNSTHGAGLNLVQRREQDTELKTMTAYLSALSTPLCPSLCPSTD